MQRKRIHSDSDRLKLITGLATHGEITHPNGTRIFTESHINLAAGLIAPFSAAMTAQSQATEGRRAAAEALGERMVRLKGLVRGAWASIRVRNLTSAGTPPYGLYGLSASGTQPMPRNRRQWLGVAKLIIDGDRVAESDGLPVLVEPNRATLEAAYTEAETANAAHESAILDQKDAQYRLQAVRGQVDEAVADTVFAVEVAFRHRHSAAKREIMRLLGFSWRGNATEPAPELEAETVTVTV